jgi:plasmid stabilization system protein ParE
MDAAFAWYEIQRLRLGSEFLRSVEAVLGAIARQPEMYPIVQGEVRRALVRRFPYGLFYVVGPSEIVVLAVIHAKRHPRTWPLRVEDRSAI